jgi:hypothetical protein
LTGLVLLSGSAFAASESQTFSSSSLLGPTSQPDSLALPSFDSDLGTLESVVVTLKFNVCPEITVDNSTNAPLSFSGVTLKAPFSVTGPGSFTYNNTTLTTSPLSGTEAPNSSTTFEPAVGWIYAVKGATTNSLGFWEDQPGDLINLVVTPGELVTTPGSSTGLQVSSTALEWDTVSVKYTYLNTAAVPEPSGKYLAFIVGTAMALIAVRRRVRTVA